MDAASFELIFVQRLDGTTRAQWQCSRCRSMVTTAREGTGPALRPTTTCAVHRNGAAATTTTEK